MQRPYNKPVNQEPTYFVAQEVEKTPAWGLKTLFVVGCPDVDAIENIALQHQVKNIYLGANKSFYPGADWETVIDRLLHQGYWVTLDYPVRYHNTVLRMANNHIRNSRFIPMISVEIPNVELYNYNTVIKIDDVGMDQTNPGVWCHYLSSLMQRDCFTSWDQYLEDQPIDS